MAKFLFVTDLDNTLVGDDNALQELNHRLEKHRDEHGTKIVYATGRSPVLYQELKQEKNLIEPDGLILAVGTEIYVDGNTAPDAAWVAQLSTGWNREQVSLVAAQFPELIPQPDSEQRPFKVSFFLKEKSSVRIIPKLESELHQAGLEIKLIYSSGVDLDIVPRNSDKGQATQFLRQKWKFVAEQTVVCGDSGNDIALFAAEVGRGILVGNARSELLQWHKENPGNHRYLATNSCAGGILEGLKYFGFIE